MKTLFLSLLCGVTFACVADEAVRNYDFRWNGARYTCILSQKSLQTAPAWRETDPHPPLAARTAVRYAAEYMQRLLPESTNWLRGDVCLSQVSGETWIYEIQFSPTRPDARYMSSIPVRIIVLMDGTVAPYARTQAFREHGGETETTGGTTNRGTPVDGATP